MEVGDESHFLTVTTQSGENGALLCITGRLVEDGEAEVLNTAAFTATEEPLLTAAQYQSKGQPMPTVSALMRTSVERYAQQSAATQAARKSSGTARDDTTDAADLAQRADELQNITDSLLASTDKMLKGLTDVAGSTNAVETDLNKGAEGTLPEQTVTVDQIKVTATPAPTDAPTPEPTEAPASDANSEPTPTEAPTQAPQPDNSTGTEGETINVTMNVTAPDDGPGALPGDGGPERTWPQRPRRSLQSPVRGDPLLDFKPVGLSVGAGCRAGRSCAGRCPGGCPCAGDLQWAGLLHAVFRLCQHGYSLVCRGLGR